MISEEPPDDVHEELVMPLAKNFDEVSEDFVEIKITSLGLEDKDQVRTQSPNSPLSFLSPSTFRNFSNLRGNMRVQAVVVLVRAVILKTISELKYIVVNRNPNKMLHSFD